MCAHVHQGQAGAHLARCLVRHRFRIALLLLRRDELKLGLLRAGHACTLPIHMHPSTQPMHATHSTTRPHLQRPGCGASGRFGPSISVRCMRSGCATHPQPLGGLVSGAGPQQLLQARRSGTAGVEGSARNLWMDGRGAVGSGEASQSAAGSSIKWPSVYPSSGRPSTHPCILHRTF